MNNCVPSFLGSVPAPITIHRKIAADDGDDLAPLFASSFSHSRKIVCATGRRRIPSVRERMNKNFLYSRSMRRFGQRQEMTIMTMHASS